jgi:FMN reductase
MTTSATTSSDASDVTRPPDDDSRALRVVVVSGNPRAGSRTVGAARVVADAIAIELGAHQAHAPSVHVIELADVAPELFAADHPNADAALAELAAADVAVIATPVYKASYTGLLKSFLDLYRAGDLASVVAVPVVVSGNPAHALAGEVHLRPLLVELGAVVPTRTLALTEAQLPDVDRAVGAWLDGATRPLRAGVAHVVTVPEPEPELALVTAVAR